MNNLMLRERLLALQAGPFESLAADFLETWDPERFGRGRLQRLGHGVHGRTLPGWPDAFSLAPGGGIHAACFGTSVSAGGLRGHLAGEVKRVESESRGWVRSFIYVASGPTPDAQTLDRLRRRLQRAGVPEDDITFLIGPSLLRELQRGRHTQVVLRHLGIRPRVVPFQTIESADLFGRGLDDLRPSRSEFDGGVVHRPHQVDQVLEELDRGGAALVRGMGAAGKSVLATHVALDARWESSYYLKLTAEDAAQKLEGALDVMDRYGDDGVLFILDDVHLAEGVARDLFDHWRRHRNGSRLLLVGRTWRRTELASVSPKLDDHGLDPIELRASPSDLAGVAARLVKRKDTAFQIDSEIAGRWEETFGGDLVAFTLALRGRLTRVGPGGIRQDWKLDHGDALRYLRERYLVGLDERERRDLLKVAAVARYELGCPAGALDGDSFAHTGTLGLVLESHSRAELYELAHFGLGELLCKAAGLKSEQMDQLAEDAAAESLWLAIWLKSKSFPDARLENAFRRGIKGRALGRLCAESPQLAGEVVRTIQVIGMIGDDELDETLHELPELQDVAIHVNAGELVALLKPIHRLPRTAARLVELVKTSGRIRAAVIEGAREGGFHFISHLLSENIVRYAHSMAGVTDATLARSRAFESLRGEVEATLVSCEGKDAVAAGLTQPGGTSHVVYLMEVAHRRAPRVFRMVEELLTTEPTRASFIEALLSEPSPTLAGVLRVLDLGREGAAQAFLASIPDARLTRFVEGVAPREVPGFVALARALQQHAPVKASYLTEWAESEEGRCAIVAGVIASGSGGLLHLLQRIHVLDRAAPGVLRELETDATLNRLSKAFEDLPPNRLPVLEMVWPQTHEVLRRMNIETWVERPAWLDRLPAEELAQVLTTLSRAGRGDLARRLSDHVVAHASRARWSKAPFRAPTQVMRLCSSGVEEKRAFLDRALGPAWLERAPSMAHDPHLAAALFGLWSHQPWAVLEWFVRPPLQRRIRAVVSRIESDLEDLSGTSSSRVPHSMLDRLRLLGIGLLLSEPEDVLLPTATPSVAGSLLPFVGKAETREETQLLVALLVMTEIDTAFPTEARLALAKSILQKEVTGRSTRLRSVLHGYLVGPASMTRREFSRAIAAVRKDEPSEARPARPRPPQRLPSPA